MIATLGIGLSACSACKQPTPPDIAGKWQGEGWGQVVLTQTAPGQYTGTYTDTVAKEKEPGKIDLKWSRIERRFNGTWSEGETTVSAIFPFRLADQQILGGADDRRQVEDQPSHAEAGAPGVDANCGRNGTQCFQNTSSPNVG